MIKEYKLDKKIPDTMIGLVKSQLAYCDEDIIKFDYSNLDNNIISYEVTDDSKPYDSKIEKIIARIVGNKLIPKTKVLKSLEVRDVKYFDVRSNAQMKTDIVSLGEGIFGMKGLPAQLFRIFDEDFRNISVKNGAGDGVYPSLLRIDFLKRIEYFKSFPHYTTLVNHLKADVDVLDSFVEKTSHKFKDLKLTESEISTIKMILAPAACYHIYDSLSDTSISNDGLLMTTSCRCYRWESYNIDYLNRLWEFQMRELLVMGSGELVAKMREKLLSDMLDYCKLIGLNCWVENANDPFFSNDAYMKSAYQKGFGMKWELRIPYNDKNDSVAAVSFNNMQKTFGESLSITMENGETIHSGCIAWGIERWVFAFLCQHGIDTNTWPEYIKNKLI